MFVLVPNHLSPGSIPLLFWFHTTCVLVPDHFCPDSIPLFCYDLRFVAAHYVARRLIYPGSLAVYNLAVGTSVYMYIELTNKQLSFIINRWRQ